MSAIQTRSHAGHSHGHGHHHHHTDPTLLLSKDKNDAAVRITRLGLYLNVVLAIGKGIAGYYWNSKSMFLPFRGLPLIPPLGGLWATNMVL